MDCISSVGGDEQCMDSGCSLKVNLRGFADSLTGWRMQDIKIVKNDSKVRVPFDQSRQNSL